MGANTNEVRQEPCKYEPPQLGYKLTQLSDGCSEAEAKEYIDNYLRNFPLSPMYHDDSTRLSVVIGELGVPFSRDRPFEGMEDKEGFKRDIRQLLAAAGCSMSDVAELRGVDKSTVSRWISNPDRLDACTAYNLLNAVACVTLNYGCRELGNTPDGWYMAVGSIARKYIPERLSERGRRWEVADYTVRRLLGLLDLEAVELLAQTARALIGGHVPPELANELDEAERDIMEHSAYVELNKSCDM